MAKEDPLERIAREEREKQEKKKNGMRGSRGLKSVVITLSVIAGVLAVGLGFQTWRSYKYSGLVSELNVEKDSLMHQFQNLQQDYAQLTSDYENINFALDSSREEINLLVERLKQTDATNRAMMRKYQAELGTLRSIMRNYIVQIDSLNTLNHQLTAEAAAARKEAAQSRRENESLNKEVEALSGQVKAGSALKARGLRLEAYAKNDRQVDKAGRVARMLVSLSLVENAIAERGPVRVYVRVTDPSGNLLSDGRGTSFTIEDQTLEATASREVDYEGEEVDMSIYINSSVKFTAGTYVMEAFTDSGRLGSASLVLRQ
ncbi:MAG: hypothetical protein MJY48_01220 [Bacteroidales bacterium]|nr:hypothetical protein [Bacteroidales bacterium]